MSGEEDYGGDYDGYDGGHHFYDEFPKNNLDEEEETWAEKEEKRRLQEDEAAEAKRKKDAYFERLKKERDAYDPDAALYDAIWNADQQRKRIDAEIKELYDAIYARKQSWSNYISGWVPWLRGGKASADDELERRLKNAQDRLEKIYQEQLKLHEAKVEIVRRKAEEAARRVPPATASSAAGGSRQGQAEAERYRREAEERQRQAAAERYRQADRYQYRVPPAAAAAAAPAETYEEKFKRQQAENDARYAAEIAESTKSSESQVTSNDTVINLINKNKVLYHIFLEYGIPIPKTIGELKREYKKLSVRIHPDRNGGNQKQTLDFRTMSSEMTKLKEELKFAGRNTKRSTKRSTKRNTKRSAKTSAKRNKKI